MTNIEQFIRDARRNYMRFPQVWKDGETIIKSRGNLYFPRIDEADVPLVSKYRWYYKDTDHINRDRMDNRRENLRFATSKQNRLNRPPEKGYRDRGYGFEAYITKDKRQRYLGTFKTEDEARNAYQSARKELFAV